MQVPLFQEYSTVLGWQTGVVVLSTDTVSVTSTVVKFNYIHR